MAKPPKHFALIGCTSLTREICWCVARSPHRIDLDFFPLNAHNDPKQLRRSIQAKIDSFSRDPFEAILLAFGLCGNASDGLTARSVPLIIPRAHDCCTLFLGSKKEFRRHFADNPSRPFSSRGYSERAQGDDPFRCDDGDTRYDDLVRQYGEEHARGLWAQMHGNPTRDRVFIDIPETTDRTFADTVCDRARQSGASITRLKGSVGLIERLTRGNWDEHEFLRVAPGKRIAGEYDWDRVVKEEESPKVLSPQSQSKKPGDS